VQNIVYALKVYEKPIGDWILARVKSLHLENILSDKQYAVHLINQKTYGDQLAANGKNRWWI